MAQVRHVSPGSSALDPACYVQDKLSLRFDVILRGSGACWWIAAGGRSSTMWSLLRKSLAFPFQGVCLDCLEWVRFCALLRRLWPNQMDTQLAWKVSWR